MDMNIILSDDDQNIAYRALMQAKAIVQVISASSTTADVEPEDLQFACWAVQEQLDTLKKIVSPSKPVAIG